MPTAHPTTAQTWIDHLHLEPLPEEGGWFRRIFTHPDTIEWRGKRLPTSSMIHFLITSEAFSALHRLPQEECFVFQAGEHALMLQLDEATGQSREIVLGLNPGGKEQPWARVPGNTWQGLRLLGAEGYALFTVTVSPAFEWDGFELGQREFLSSRFPQSRCAIKTFTRA